MHSTCFILFGLLFLISCASGYSLEKAKSFRKSDNFNHRQDNSLTLKVPLATISTPAPEPSTFWVSTEVRSIQWKRNCLTTMLCSEPKFTLANAMPKFNEKVTSDWSLSTTLIPENPYSLSNMQLYSYWIKGQPEDVTIQAYVIGTDPAFRFNRLCDETPNVHIFHRHQFGGLENGKTNSDGSSKTEGSAETALELHGNCFNVTLVVRNHMRKCPWCANIDDENKSMLLQDIQGKNAMFYSGNDLFFGHNSRAFILFLIALTVLNAVIFIGFVFACRKKRQIERKPMQVLSTLNSKSRLSQEPFPRSQSQRMQRYSAPMPLSPPPPSPTDPNVVDEDYESIHDESIIRPPSVHPYLVPKRSEIRRASLIQVRLPTSRRCDHCFLQSLDKTVPIQNFPYPMENCSCEISLNSSAFNSSRESDSGFGCPSEN